MQVRPLATLVLALCAASALARPDCNACFMKNAATAGTPTEGTPPPPTTPSPRQGGAAAAARPDPLLRPKRMARMARAAAAGWDHDVDNVQNRLRDVMVAENANTAPGQWWDDSPVEVVDAVALGGSASARWPYRGRWRESHAGRNQNQNQNQGGGAWGDVTDAVAQKVGQGFV